MTATVAIEEILQPKEMTTAEVVIKKSRFIGHIVPVNSVEAAEAELERIRTDHKAANHNCYAYAVGLGVPNERFSDDGEPSGTAGRPILEVLRRRGLTNTLIVVTRYFGGVLLGANGLVRAYAETAAAAIGAADLMICRQMQRLWLDLDYAQYGKLEYELTQAGYEMMDKAFADKVGCAIWVSIDDVDKMVEQIADWSDGAADVTAALPEWVGQLSDGLLLFNVLKQEGLT